MPDIVPGQIYRLCNQPALGYFSNKYGTAAPLISIENRDTIIWEGKSWSDMLAQCNPAALQFALRTMTEQLAWAYSLNDEVWYGKVEGLGELVFRDELQEV